MLTKSINEELLVKELVQGSQDAFQAIFMHYYPKVHNFVYGLVKSQQDAEDISQEVFSKVWGSRSMFADVRNLGAYLFILSKNTTFNFLEARQIRIERLNEKPFEEEAHDSPDEDLIAKDLQLLIDMVVANMPPQRKLIYQLSREAGLSNAEIAEKLDLSKKTVENHLNLALKELRKILLYLLILYSC